MYLLSIPYKSKPGSKLPIFGIAKYIISDDGEIMQEWCELKPGTFFKGLENQNKNSNFHKSGGKEKYGGDFNKKVITMRQKIMKNDVKDYEIQKDQVRSLNQYFQENLTTFLNHDLYTTGSNTSGSKYDFRRSPYLIDGGKYNQLMFTHVFDSSLRKRNSKKLNPELRKKTFKNISLEEYLDLFPLIREKFLSKNRKLFLVMNSEKIDDTKEMDTSNEVKDYIELITDASYLEGSGKNNAKITEKRILVLRRIFKNRMRKEEEPDQFFGKLSESMCEAAHIFPVKEIKNLPIEKWNMIADPNNGLNLPVQIHKMYDKHFVHFDEQKNMVYNNPEYESQLKLIFNFSADHKLIAKNFDKKIPYIKMYNSL